MIEKNVFHEYGFWIDTNGSIIPFCFFKDKNQDIGILNQINQISLTYNQLEFVIDKLEDIIKGKIIEYEFNTNLADFSCNKTSTLIENHLFAENSFKILTGDFLVILKKKKRFINSFSKLRIEEIIDKVFQIVENKSNTDKTNSLFLYFDSFYVRVGTKDKSKSLIKEEHFNFISNDDIKSELKKEKWIDLPLLVKKSIKTQRVFNYHFFDGIKLFEVKKNYDNWLSSSEYHVYSTSYIKVNNHSISLFGKSRKTIEEFFSSNRTLLADLAREFQLEIEDNHTELKIYNKKHKYDTYYVISEIIDNNNYIILYSLGGSRFPESLTIYGTILLN